MQQRLVYPGSSRFTLNEVAITHIADDILLSSMELYSQSTSAMTCLGCMDENLTLGAFSALGEACQRHVAGFKFRVTLVVVHRLGEGSSFVCILVFVLMLLIVHNIMYNRVMILLG